MASNEWIAEPGCNYGKKCNSKPNTIKILFFVVTLGMHHNGEMDEAPARGRFSLQHVMCKLGLMLGSPGSLLMAEDIAETAISRLTNAFEAVYQ